MASNKHQNFRIYNKKKYKLKFLILVKKSINSNHGTMCVTLLAQLRATVGVFMKKKIYK